MDDFKKKTFKNSHRQAVFSRSPSVGMEKLFAEIDKNVHDNDLTAKKLIDTIIIK